MHIIIRKCRVPPVYSGYLYVHIYIPWIPSSCTWTRGDNNGFLVTGNGSRMWDLSLETIRRNKSESRDPQKFVKERAEVRHVNVHASG